MNRKEFPNTTFIAGMLLSTFFYALQVQAASVGNRVSSSISNSAFSTLKQLSFNASSDDFAGDERPGNRTSGGSRGSCLDQLIALVPGSGEIPVGEATCEPPSSSLLAQTVDDTPTFWFYVPAYSQSSSQPSTVAEFVLLDKNGQILQTEQITLTETSGIVAVPLTQPLDLNQPYQWIFSILINSRNPSQNPTVNGWVQRVEPNLALSNDLAQASSESAQIAAYANHGVWYDALTQLAMRRQADPDNPALVTDWHDLLSSVGLRAIADAPLLNQ